MESHQTKRIFVHDTVNPSALIVFLFIALHRYGNSKEHMTVTELKLFLETEQKGLIQNYVNARECECE
ncbi:hypothetical protein ACROYT_G022937 [Oculina patagonica]